MPQLNVRLIFKLAPVVVMAALLLPSVASAQATRTWVSGVGDDANPCSRTAPCKTFAGAISKTAAGGIINAMDDGGFGTLTITKPITVDGGHHTAGVLSSGGINGINININPATQPANFVNNGRVVLKNLKMEGNTSIPSSGGFTPGLNGVRITNARNVKIVDSDIGFYSRSAIAVEPDASQATKVQVVDSYIHDNGGAGITAAPKGGGNVKLTARNNEIDDNGCGITVASFGLDSAFNFANDCALASFASSGFAGTSTVFASNNSITDGTGAAGVMARGSTATIRMTGNDVTRNNGVGVRGFEGATVLSFGNNAIADNGATGTNDGGFTGSVIPLQKHGKRH
jgi:hypothetical protein